MRTHVKSAALLLALASAGCSLIVDPAESDPLKTAEGFCNSIQDTVAHLDCSGASSSFLEQILGRQRTSCDTLQAAVDAGRFAYSSSRAKACMDGLLRLGCRGIASGGSVFPWPAACAEALQGNVAEGGDCTYQEWASGNYQTAGPPARECTAGTGCYSPVSAACGGVCQRPAGNGESCVGGRPCSSGLVCSASAGLTCRDGRTGSPCGLSSSDCAAGYQCSAGFCAPLPSAGMPCTPFPGCDLDSVCDGGFCIARVGAGQYCPGNSGYCIAGLACWGGICRAPAAEGQDCSANGCASGLYCRSSTLTCAAYPAYPLARGEDCSGLGTYACADHLFCDPTGVVGTPLTCQPQVGPGGDCASGTYDACLPGTTCVYDPAASPPTYTCRSYLAQGQACDAGAGIWCQTGLYCRIDPAVPTSTAGVCAPYPGDGESCINGTGSVPCGAGTYATTGTSGCDCVRLRGEGEQCTDDYACGYTKTGLRCVANVCQMVYACEVPIGWLPMNGF